MLKSTLVTPVDLEYPESVRSILEPAPDLYIRGNITSKDAAAVAIVGTRSPTEYGIYVAKTFVQAFSKKGITIVSGLARGIDTVAHLEALTCGGRTIAVMGHGLSLLYPPENSGLAKKIIENGALVSEFPDSVPITKSNFLRRNRIIAALSLCIVVVEGGARSGTLSTAAHAARLGREVFAVPGPINAPASAAPNYLIREGAQIATSPQDVLDYLEKVVDIPL